MIAILFNSMNPLQCLVLRQNTAKPSLSCPEKRGIPAVAGQERCLFFLFVPWFFHGVFLTDFYRPAHFSRSFAPSLPGGAHRPFHNWARARSDQGSWMKMGRGDSFLSTQSNRGFLLRLLLFLGFLVCWFGALFAVAAVLVVVLAVGEKVSFFVRAKNAGHAIDSWLGLQMKAIQRRWVS